MFGILIGFIFGAFVFEPLIINFVYLSNVSLFFDIILTKKNVEKIKEYLYHKESRM